MNILGLSNKILATRLNYTYIYYLSMQHPSNINCKADVVFLVPASDSADMEEGRR